MTTKPSLPALERLVAARRNIEALQMALNVLQAIDKSLGGIGGVETGGAYSVAGEEDAAVVFATRFAAAFGRLVTEPDLEISAPNYERLATQHRWIDLIFSLSGFRSSDSFLSLIAQHEADGRATFARENILRMLLLFGMTSVLEIDFERLWRANRAAAAVALLSYISSRYVFTRRAMDFRERLLEWLPDRLAEVNIGGVTLSNLSQIYMHCSYAFTPKKHAIKRPLLEQMRRACLEAGAAEAAEWAPPPSDERATVVVVGEQFVEGHATFRCFAPAVRSLRRRFNVIGVVYPDPGQAPMAAFFDETIAIPTGDFLAAVRAVAADVVARRPALIWYLGVGMIPQVIALASLRLAPIQCASIGHNASTMSPVIDYFVLPEDWIGARECFSEKILALPKAAMPFAPRSRPQPRQQPSDRTVRVAICASIMKLNPVLFDAISRIAAKAGAEVEFHLFSLAATGLAYFALARAVHDSIPCAVVHPHAPYEIYMERLAKCDFFLSPFPHGGMTSIIDTFQLGMPGVCLDGAEPHAHADAALFARIGLPTELATKSVDEYVAAAVRLIDDQTWRIYCAETVRMADLDAAFFTGEPDLFCRAMQDLIWPPAR